MSDLNAIFDMDPLDLTKDDPKLEIVIDGYRAKRDQYNLGITNAGRVTKPKPAQVKGLDIDDILGDIKL